MWKPVVEAYLTRVGDKAKRKAAEAELLEWIDSMGTVHKREDNNHIKAVVELFKATWDDIHIEQARILKTNFFFASQCSQTGLLKTRVYGNRFKNLSLISRTTRSGVMHFGVVSNNGAASSTRKPTVSSLTRSMRTRSEPSTRLQTSEKRLRTSTTRSRSGATACVHYRSPCECGAYAQRIAISNAPNVGS